MNMLYTRETTGDIDATGKRLAEAVKAHKFGVLGVIDLQAKMKEKADKSKETERMRTKWAIGTVAASGILAVGISVLLAGSALAHCDTTKGPIIPEAKAALEKGDVTPILKWIKQNDEAEIRVAFTKAVAVRAEGPKAKELADLYFIETLIRLHRAGEGAPYTGIKDEPVEPIIAMAEKALVDGSADEMTKKISGQMAAAIKKKFTKVVEANKDKDKSVEAGREFVEAYVQYMHYIEDIHTVVMSAGGHHGEEAKEPARHEDKD